MNYTRLEYSLENSVFIDAEDSSRDVSHFLFGYVS